ncbi:class I SAM-dependent methyltransferase [Oscillatoriales cyanobacterium LEGE 11467]|uniref:Class I SAM-dependent methyltransferase n=1 Tax=Zarconia navalis LEGE 11467 TaxID=1828826 RepID=A0A928Z888_9CYAN|nr:class I SAM-dependent methyltransferase [Zarconia navalis]MBE9041335.1 class I SAM-dependent methyltransferase [Zarconia navalis LEGE 11467]
MTFKDYFSKQASAYSTYRPRYPDALFEYLASQCDRCDRVWDCATGSGQVAMSLVPYFKKIIATDASASQIENAAPHPLINYRVEPAEQTTIETHSIDLATVGQALHWFDIERFYVEVKRVLKPGGILAVWCYQLLSISEKIDPIIEEYYHQIIGEYWSPERQLIEEGYRSIDFPFEERVTPQFQMEAMWSLDRVFGYLETWSATQRFISARNSNPIDLIRDRLSDVWGDIHLSKLVRTSISMRIGEFKSDVFT